VNKIKIRTYILNDCVYCWSSMSVDILCCEAGGIWLIVFIKLYRGDCVKNVCAVARF
jgi:hypothetical protein